MVEVVAVRVPRIASAAEVSRSDTDLNDGDARLRQPSREQQALSRDVIAVGLAHLRTLVVEVVRVLHRRTGQQVFGQRLEVIEAFVVTHRVRPELQGLQQLASFGQSSQIDFAEVQDFRSQRFGTPFKRLATRRTQHDGIVLHAEPTAVFARLQGFVIDHRIRQTNGIRHAARCVAELGNHRGNRRPVVSQRRNVGDARRLVTGQVPVHASPVERVVVMDRTDDRELVGVSSQERQMLANLNARHDSRDRRMITSNLQRGIGLEIERFEMTHPTPAEDDDARLRGADVGGSGCGRSAAPLQEAGQRQTTDPRRGGERAAARDGVVQFQ